MVTTEQSVMTSENNRKQNFNMELCFDVSRRWRRPVQIMLTLLSVALLYFVTSSQIDKPLETIDETDLVQHVADDERQVEMRQQIDEAPHIQTGRHGNEHIHASGFKFEVCNVLLSV